MEPAERPRQALIVEDNVDISRLVGLHLRDLGFESDNADDGVAALALFSSKHYDLVILDLMLPGLNGLEVCREIRKQAGYTPVLMLTAKSTELDRVVGLESGADDYVTKPFSVIELMARVKALLRRADAMAQDDGHVTAIITHADLEIDVKRRKVTVAGRTVELTAKEFDLLLYFARHPGTVHSRSELLQEVWGYKHDGYEHTVNSHINRLRAKIEDNAADPRYILTVWGVGYKFSEA
ncbi:MAG: response regulator transcription factor [Gammaproteobacteria bacterium]|nr:response regulator transcription factor [Gammaproteobacteria bacterium]